MGDAALAAIAPKAAVPVLPEPTAAELGDLRARLPTGDAAGRIEVLVRAQHVVIAIPNGALFIGDATALSEPGKQLVRQLAGLLDGIAHRDFQIVAADGMRAMEVAGTLAIAGVAVERLSMAVATNTDKRTVDIVLIARLR